jgi:glycerol-3-phosphate acyltransferase PlsY
MGKGAFAVWLCRQPGDTVMAGWLYGLAAILGHCYSPWLRFNGGKGIATSGGVMVVLYPAWAALTLAFFAALRVAGGKLKWKEAGMIASLATWLLFTVLMGVFVGSRDASVAGAMTAFLAWRHKKNFENLLPGPAS